MTDTIDQTSVPAYTQEKTHKFLNKTPGIINDLMNYDESEEYEANKKLIFDDFLSDDLLELNDEKVEKMRKYWDTQDIGMNGSQIKRDLTTQDLDTIMESNDKINAMIKKSWQLIRKLAGKPIQEIITEVNNIFGANFENQYQEGEEVLDSYLSLRDAMIKSGIYSIVSKEQCQTIRKAFEDTKSDEIHFHCVGAGYEVLSFKESGVFSREEMPPYEAFDRDYTIENG